MTSIQSLKTSRRILSIWLARLSVDRWRLSNAQNPGHTKRGEGIDSLPTALITETAHGPRIDSANDAGIEAGARKGMMLADVRTLCPAIQVAPSDPAGDIDALEKITIWAQRWGPWSAMDPPDGVLVDVTAVAHLFGGERRLLADAQALFDKRGLAARFAIAPTAGAAWALSHYGPPRAILSPDDDMIMRLSQLPVAALRLDDDVMTVLRRLGLKRLSDLTGIEGDGAGRDAIMRRFRNRRSPAANPLVRMDQLLGKVPEPLLPVIPLHMPLVQRRLMEPIRHRELLDQVVGDLAQDMARELEGQGKGARRLELGMWRVDGEVVARALEMAAATRDAAHICRLFSNKINEIDAGFGIETVRLCASWTEPLALEQGDIEAAAQSHGTSLAACVDRLNVRLGAGAVSRPVPFASHIPERAQRWQPPLEPEPVSPHGLQGELALHHRPLKMLDRSERITVLYATPDGYPRSFRWRGHVHEVVRVEGPERIAPEWWREKSTIRLRDYYRIEDGEGRRYWIYRHGLIGDNRGGLPDWYLQGLCA